MTRRGFIKRIGGVAASALVVASIPALIDSRPYEETVYMISLGPDGIEASRRQIKVTFKRMEEEEIEYMEKMRKTMSLPRF